MRAFAGEICVQIHRCLLFTTAIYYPCYNRDAMLDVMRSVLDSKFIEHDTFALFTSLMSRAKPWYEFSDEGFASKRPRVRTESEGVGYGILNLMKIALRFFGRMRSAYWRTIFSHANRLFFFCNR